MNTLTYRYKASPLSIGIGCLFCGGLAGYALVLATTNDRGLIINGIVELSKSGATIFWWCIAALPFAGFILSVAVFLSSVLSTPHITLAQAEVWIPATSFSRKRVSILIRRISDLSIAEFGDSKYLHITEGSLRSRKIIVARSFFSSHAEFEEFYSELRGRVSSGNTHKGPE